MSKTGNTVLALFTGVLMWKGIEYLLKINTENSIVKEEIQEYEERLNALIEKFNSKDTKK